MNKFFLDTAYVIALSAVTDQYHQKAEILSRQIETEAIPLITTRAVILEIGNALAKLRYRAAAIELLDSLEEDLSSWTKLFCTLILIIECFKIPHFVQNGKLTVLSFRPKGEIFLLLNKI